MSINLGLILDFLSVPRAPETLAILLLVVVIASLALVPQSPRALGAQVALHHIPKDRQNPVQQTLRMIYNITRLHDLKVDPSASRHQSLFVALTQTPGQDGLESRFDTEFFQPEPPEERYRVLHAACEQGHDMSRWTQA